MAKRSFDVEIRQTLVIVDTIEAETKREAMDIAEQNYNDGLYEFVNNDNVSIDHDIVSVME